MTMHTEVGGRPRDPPTAPDCAGERVMLYNYFFRALGCRFSGDRPGVLLEVLTDDESPDAATLCCRLFARLVRLSGYAFSYPDEFEQSFNVLQRLIDQRVPGQEFLGKVHVDPVLRLFRSLAGQPITDAAELAVRVVEAVVDRLDGKISLPVLGGAELGDSLLPSGKTGYPSGPRVMSANQHYVFVSYSHKDEPLVSPIVRLVRVVGAGAFQDRDSIEPGRVWREVILTALGDATLVVIFWSRHSAASEEVRAEWVEGLRLRKRVVPILLDSTPLDPQLTEYQTLDFRPFSVAETSRSEEGGLRETLKLGLGRTMSANAAAELLTFIHEGSD